MQHHPPPSAAGHRSGYPRSAAPHARRVHAAARVGHWYFGGIDERAAQLFRPPRPFRPPRSWAGLVSAAVAPPLRALLRGHHSSVVVSGEASLGAASRSRRSCSRRFMMPMAASMSADANLTARASHAGAAVSNVKERAPRFPTQLLGSEKQRESRRVCGTVDANQEVLRRGDWDGARRACLSSGTVRRCFIRWARA